MVYETASVGRLKGDLQTSSRLLMSLQMVKRIACLIKRHAMQNLTRLLIKGCSSPVARPVSTKRERLPVIETHRNQLDYKDTIGIVPDRVAGRWGGSAARSRLHSMPVGSGVAPERAGAEAFLAWEMQMLGDTTSVS